MIARANFRRGHEVPRKTLPTGYRKKRDIPGGPKPKYRIWFACPASKEAGYLDDVGYLDHIVGAMARIKLAWPDAIIEAHEIEYVTVPGGHVVHMPRIY